MTVGMEVLHTACGDGTMAWRAFGAGPPLVLLHGGSGSWRHWTRTIPRFSANYRVLAADLPGLGNSALPPDPTPDGIATVVAEGLTGLLDGEPVNLVGFSFGAQIAARVAARGHPLRSLTLVGSSALGTRGGPPIALAKVRALSGSERPAAHRTNLHRIMIADPARIDALALDIQEWNSLRSRLNSRGWAAGTHVREALRHAAVPRVNAIWGRRDQVAVHDLQERVQAVHAARPDATVRLIDDAGHWVAYERAAEFNAALAKLIA